MFDNTKAAPVHSWTAQFDCLDSRCRNRAYGRVAGGTVPVEI